MTFFDYSVCKSAVTVGRLLSSVYALKRTAIFSGWVATTSREREIPQEFTAPDMPKLNRLVERGISIVNGNAHAACPEAPGLFPGM